MLVHHGMLAKSGNVGSVNVSLINSFWPFLQGFVFSPLWVPCNS